MTLRVTVEIVPFGEEEKAYEIHRLDIFNKGPAGFGHYEYGVISFNEEKKDYGMYERTVYHRRNLGALALVEKVLREIIQ